MLEDVAKSGVVFTWEIEMNAPNYVVSYTAGDDTAAVTGGAETHFVMLVCYKHAALPVRDKDMEGLLEFCAKIESTERCGRLMRIKPHLRRWGFHVGD